MLESEVQNRYIWIEAEQWAPGEWDPIDCNSDVIVSFEKGAEWVATLFTYQNIQTLIEKNKHTGECLQGKYFWARDMILVEEVTRNRAEEIVAHLIAEDEFEKIFRINDV